MQRNNFSSGAPWEDVVGYSRCVRVGDFVCVSGTTAIDARGHVIGAGDAGAQMRRCLEIIEQSLARVGSGLADVVRTRIYVTDISLWESVGRVHGEFFGEIRPAATMVEVSRLIDPELLVEVEADAIVSSGDGPA